MANVQSSAAFLDFTTDQPESFLCNNHCEDLLKNIKDRQDLCDVVLKAGDYGQPISAHRLILIGANAYFSCLLGKPGNREITLKDVDGDALEELIDFCYTGKLEFKGHTIEALLTAASHLHMEEVVDGCCDFIQRHLTPSNCLAALFLAERQNIEALSRSTKDYVKQNFREVSNSRDFFLLNTSLLSEFITSDKLDVPCELIFEVVVKWIEHKPKNRMKELTKLFALLPLHQMSSTFLSKKVEPLCNTNESKKLVSSALKSHLSAANPRKSVNSCTLRARTKSLTHSNYLVALTKKKMEERDYFRIDGYDLRSRKWTSCDTTARYRASCTATLMDNNLIVVGGKYSANVTCINLHTTDVTQMAPLEYKRWYHGAVLLNGSIYVIGGTDGNKDLKKVERWDHDKRTWNLVAPLKTARSNFGIGVHKGYLYVSGGLNKGHALASVECYDLAANIWTSRVPMKCRRSSHCLVSLKGSLYAIGGYQNNSVESYNTNTDTWTLISYSPPLRKQNRILSTSIDQDVFIYDDDRCYEVTSESTSESLMLKELCKSDCTDLVGFLGYIGELCED